MSRSSDPRPAAGRAETVLSARHAFRSEIAYHVVDSAPASKGKKPLILYLHGFGQNRTRFEALCRPLLHLDAYHVHVDGLYPVYERTQRREASEWGRAWYLYDGSKERLRSSLEVASEFLQELVEPLFRLLSPSGMCVNGYSMGGYLAGYFALTRWKHVTELVASGCRIQHEVVGEQGWESRAHLNVLALHGADDTLVLPGPQQDSIDVLRSNGLNAAIRILHAGHEFSDAHAQASAEWLSGLGYATTGSNPGSTRFF